MALRDPAAGEGVEVVAHIYGRRVDAEVKRIDWAKTDARATSEKERKNVIISFDWDDGKTTKNYSEPIAEESLTLRDGSPFRTKDYEQPLPAARKKKKPKRLVTQIVAGQIYAAEESCAYCGGSTCLSDPRCGDVLICDRCEAEVHRSCAALATVPEGDWFCRGCAKRPRFDPKPAARPSPAPCPRKGMAIEIRRVGGASWQRFGSQTAAAKAFGLTQAEVSYLVNDRSKASARAREFEARRVAAGSAPAPAPAAPPPAAAPPAPAPPPVATPPAPAPVPVAPPPVAAPAAPSPPLPLRFEEAEDDDDAGSVNVIDISVSDDEAKAPAPEPMAEEEEPMAEEEEEPTGPGLLADPAALKAVAEVERAVKTLPPGEHIFGVKSMGGVQVSADTEKFPEVVRALTKLYREHGTAGPGTKYVSSVFVCSVPGRAQNYHLDENNCSLTSTFALGVYTGGNLVVGVGRDRVIVDTRPFARGDGRPLYVFDACGDPHRATPWEGNRWVVSYYRVRPCILRRLNEEDRAELLALGFPLPPSAREIDEANRKVNGKHREGDRAATEAAEKRLEAKRLLAEAEALEARAEADRAA